MPYRDRLDAGQQLGARLVAYRHASPMVVALDAGSVPVAREVARILDCHLEGLTPALSLEGRTVLLVSDGRADASELRAAVQALRRRTHNRIVVGLPVATREALRALRVVADEVICTSEVEGPFRLRAWYELYPLVSDADAQLMVEAHHAERGEPIAQPRVRELREGDVQIITRETPLQGSLAVPEDARGLVLFAHAAGSNRSSPRNRFVAQALQQRGLATLLIDLLTDEDEPYDLRTGQLRFDVLMLARRLLGAAEWASRVPAIASLGVGHLRRQYGRGGRAGRRCQEAGRRAGSGVPRWTP